MNEETILTVIVTVYNVEKYIAKCLESILSQDVESMEIIVIDDKSEDDSYNICKKYFLDDKRIKLLQNSRNEGITYTRKRGIREATGRYICFVDADDYIEKEHFKRLVEYIDLYSCDFVQMGYKYEYQNEIYTYMNKNEIIELDIQKRFFLIEKNVVENKRDNTIIPSMWSKIYKAMFIKKLFEFIPNKITIGEDRLFLVYCLMNADKIMICNLSTYHYVYRNNSYMHNYSATAIAQRGIQYLELVSVFEKYNLTRYIADLDQQFINFTLYELKMMGMDVIRYKYEDILSLKDKRIILFGAGDVGSDYYKQFQMMQACKIIAWVDNNYMNCKGDYMDIESPLTILKHDYDCILIAVNNSTDRVSIEGQLVELGVDKNKIL